MITIMSEAAGVPQVSIGVEQCLVHYVRNYGHIISLDRWAHEWGINPWWVRRCAHIAASKGLLKLTRLQNISGRPYKVSLEEERNDD